MDTGQSAQVADMGGEHSTGVCVVERDRDRERGEVSSPCPPTKQRSLRVVYVLNDGLKSVMASSPESGALQCLQRACDSESALLTTVTFGRLDFGETSVLDSFYDAAVEIFLFLLPDIAVVDMSDVFRQPSLFYHLGASSGNYYFIPYIVTPNHEYMCCESDAQRRASEYMQPSWDNLLGPLCVPLFDRFTSLLKDIHVTSCASFKDTLLNDIRKAREKYQGEELAKELSRIKLRIDNTEVLTQDIVMNLLFSYRDIQDYDAMVKLVETLEMLPTSPDMFCLCGRIYKDIFLDSDCKDTKNRDNAIQWYRKGFELQPTLYSGINLAVLLIVAGQQFESSIELRKIGVRLNSLLGRKGSLEKMNNYWDVGQFFTVSMLANDIPKATQAAEKLFKLKPPLWYLRSVVQNLQLIQRFKKQTVEHSPQRERLNFWMDIIVEATQRTTNRLRFPVLILEPTKVYQPSYVSINNEAEEKNVSIWHKGIHEWNFNAMSIKGIRFCSMVKEMISDGTGNAVELEGEGDGDTLEVREGALA
ncbi:Mitogen-activated protein kinase kinase kinase 15 [Collichthys lucidus]|uniref:Mitogen-activated protein kinase kinase kinase 15 n=1 Tax=Collichthys lucidus TaxID=240159 RepID=A0A4U5VGZ4_COLLU|nr:Mitogen-activated protein kinase kinase kinase 15 [Collichthys lucidus]